MLSIRRSSNGLGTLPALLSLVPFLAAPSGADDGHPTQDARFAGRFEGKAELRASHGGEGTERAVADALAWLAAAQTRHGSWVFRHDELEEGAARSTASKLNDIGLTGLALLAFLGDGNTPERGPYKLVVERAIDWLLDQQHGKTGALGDPAAFTHLYNHGIATLALSEAYDLTEAEAIARPAQRALDYIASARNPYGAWRYDVPPTGENDTSVTGWMVLALQAGELAGLKVDLMAYDGATNWFQEVTDPETGRVGYDSRGSVSSRLAGLNELYPPDAGEAMTAIALHCRLSLGEPIEPIFEKQAELLLKKQPDWDPMGYGCDMYYWYFGSLAMRRIGGRAWEAWNASMKTALVDSQLKEGENAGSWDPVGPWGRVAGRVYSTALLALALESYYRYDYSEPAVAVATPAQECNHDEVGCTLHHGPAATAPADEVLSESPFDDEAFNDVIGIGSGAGGRIGGRFQRRNDIRAAGGIDTVEAVESGLEWLKRHQSPDGSWDADGFTANCEVGQKCDGAGDSLHDVGTTGLALLAFLGDGNTLRHGPYKDVVVRGIKWLRQQQDFETGLFGQQIGHAFHYDHAIATLAVCEAYYFSKSPLIKGTAQKAINYILRARNPYGAWRYDVPPVGDNDTSVTTWMILALKSADEADLKIDKEAYTGALNWIDEVTDPANGRVGYDSMGSVSSRITGVNDHYPPEKGEAMTAAGLLCRFFLGQDPKEHPVMAKHADLILKTLPEWKPERFSADMYYWYYGTYAMYQMGGRYWKVWNAALKEAILPSQREDGDFAGSWDPVGPWGHTGGRVYSTACMTLSLEVQKRYARVIGARSPDGNPIGLGGGTGGERAVRDNDVIGVGGASGADVPRDATEAVGRALDWIAGSQREVGSWSADHDGSSARSPFHDVGVTGLAVVALMADGNTLHEGEHSAAVVRGVKWLREQQSADTGLLGDHAGHTFLYDHAIGTLALCRAYDVSRSPVLKATAQKAVNYIARARNPYGAWRYDVPPIGDNDTSVTGWMVSALVEAKGAGLRVDEQAFQGALNWLDEVTDPANGRVGYDSMGSVSSRVVGVNQDFPPDSGEAMTGVGLYCRWLLGQEPGAHPIMEKHADLMLKKLPRWDPQGLGCDMYYWYFGTRGMSAMGGPRMDSWKRALEKALLEGQRRDGDVKGSWDPVGPWGYAGGRVYSTALMALSLSAAQ